MSKFVKLSEEAYKFEGKLSLSSAIPLGLQHVLAMFVGNLTPVLIIGGACGIICDGIGSAIAAVFGVLPNTSFSQNVGLVAMTKIVNRFALATGAVFLILCGLIPKLGALVSIMPQSVLGGAAVMMFSSIVVSGIQLVTKEKLNPRSLTIISVALGVGYGMGATPGILAHCPEAMRMMFGESGIVPAAFVAILLNVILNRGEDAQA